MTFLDCVSVTSWALVYAVISFEVHSLILGVGFFGVNVFTTVLDIFLPEVRFKCEDCGQLSPFLGLSE